MLLHNDIPLALYIHLPWCVRKCPYCDFNSHRAGDAPPRQRYIDALVSDLRIESQRAALGGRSITSVFLGGGTPSLFSGDEVGRLLDATRALLPVADDAEITMEANPGTVERGNMAAYRAAGVNRLSLGAQSFSAESLQRIGRIHGPDEIKSAFAAARDAGFENINVDVMFALPGQTVAMASDDIEHAIALRPEHISYYQLTLEPNTVFHARPPADLPDDETSWQIQETGQRRLAAAGYEQYEVSAYAQPGFRCRHNLNYWQFGDYLAIGAGAHGKLTDGYGAIRRYRKPAHPSDYMRQAERGEFADAVQQLGVDDAIFEFTLNALRLQDGFSESLFKRRTGLPLSLVAARLKAARNDRLLRLMTDDVWIPTDLGRRFLNDLQARFMHNG